MPIEPTPLVTGAPLIVADTPGVGGYAAEGMHPSGPGARSAVGVAARGASVFCIVGLGVNEKVDDGGAADTPDDDSRFRVSSSTRARAAAADA